MITTYKILDMERLNPDGIVFLVKYEFRTFSGQNFVTKRGQVQLEESPSQEGFIPFELLTETIVTDWVKEKLNETTVNSIKEELESQLRLKLKDQFEKESRGRRISNGLPWVK